MERLVSATRHWGNSAAVRIPASVLSCRPPETRRRGGHARGVGAHRDRTRPAQDIQSGRIVARNHAEKHGQRRAVVSNRRCDTEMRHRPNAHATISGNSSRQNAPPCDPARSFMTTSASASRSASAHLIAFSRKNGSCVPATRYARGSGFGITPGGL